MLQVRCARYSAFMKHVLYYESIEDSASRNYAVRVLLVPYLLLHEHCSNEVLLMTLDLIQYFQK